VGDCGGNPGLTNGPEGPKGDWDGCYKNKWHENLCIRFFMQSNNSRLLTGNIKGLVRALGPFLSGEGCMNLDSRSLRSQSL